MVTDIFISQLYSTAILRCIYLFLSRALRQLLLYLIYFIFENIIKVSY